MSNVAYGLPVVDVFERPAKGFALKPSTNKDGEARTKGDGAPWYTLIYGMHEISLYDAGKASTMALITVNNGSPIHLACRVLTQAVPEGVKYVYLEASEGDVIERLGHPKFALLGSSVRHDADGNPILLTLLPTAMTNPGSTFGGFAKADKTVERRLLEGEQFAPLPAQKGSYEWGLWKWGRAAAQADKQLNRAMKDWFYIAVVEGFFGMPAIGNIHMFGVMGHLANSGSLIVRRAAGDETATGVNNVLTIWRRAVQLAATEPIEIVLK